VVGDATKDKPFNPFESEAELPIEQLLNQGKVSEQERRNSAKELQL